MEVTAGDICDRDSVVNAVRGNNIVFHLAALIAIPYSYHAPASYVRTNIEGTLNILQAAREQGVDCLVQTSTSEVYGTARYVPIDESHPLQGQSPYSASKIGADKLAEAFFFSFGLPVVTLRPFNTFGPRQSARAIIPAVITQCLTGNIVCLGNVHPTRDFNYVANTVDGFLLAGGSPKAVGRTINLGSAREVGIKELALMIGRMVNREIELKVEEERIRPQTSEVERLLADDGAAREILGWEPAVSLEEGLQLTIQWFKEHLDDYRADAYVL